MLKRTTIYLEDTEVETLKKISFIQSVSMAELIRRGVQELCKSYSKEQKEALATLADIKADAKKDGITSKAAMSAALKTQKDVRRERKTSRR
jgi:Arc/MetJ-type ribon-helix-helix transcriptional regulator